MLPAVPLQPDPAPGASTPMELDLPAAATPAAQAGAGDGFEHDTDNEDRRAAPGAGSLSGSGSGLGRASPGARRHWSWQGSSTSAVLSHLYRDLDWLPRQPRCAAMVLVCLEACLANLPGPHPARREAAAEPEPGLQLEAGTAEPLAGLLEKALGACQELSPPALLAALRCLHTSLRRRLLAATAGGALGRHAGELFARLAECMAVVSSSACRLQACCVMGMLVGAPDAAARLLGWHVAGGNAAAGDGEEAALPSVCAAISARLYDAADDVRCAALGLAREVVVAVEGPGLRESAATGGQGRLQSVAGGAAARLLSEISQLRDVAPGSAFHDEYHAFSKWAARHAS